MHMLKYYIIDDAKGTTREFDSIMDLAMHLKNAKTLLKNLNVTGKDTIREPVNTPTFRWNDHLQTYVQHFSFEYRLRRYRIMDSNGRHIDPRAWTASFWTSVPELPRPVYHFWRSGSKYNRRRISGPSLRTRDARMLNGFQPSLDLCDLTNDEFDLLGDLYIPDIRIRPSVKHYPIRDYDWYDEAFNQRCHRAVNKSWKRNKNTPRQYMRHKPAKQLARGSKHDLFLEACIEEEALEFTPKEAA